MKPLTVRLPDWLAADIDAEARRRQISRSEVVRERLALSSNSGRSQSAALEPIADLIGSVHGLPADLSGQTKRYLRALLLEPKDARRYRSGRAVSRQRSV